MKVLAHAVMLCCYAAASATGGDSREMNHDRLIVCSQFVIEDPDSTMSRDATQYCCRFANRIHDCHVDEWGERQIRSD
jgi:hypothetical protein